MAANRIRSPRINTAAVPLADGRTDDHSEKSRKKCNTASKRFGRSSEKMAPDNQIAFMEVDGKIVFFNEAEAVAAITKYDENEPVKQRSQTILNHTIILNI